MAQILIFLLLFVSLNANDIFKVKSFHEFQYKNVTKQTYEESCGASSLATLMNLYDANVSEKDLLSDLNSTNVVNFLDLQKIAQKDGFRAKGYNISKKIFKQLSFPIIARVLRHSDYPHFIVVYNIKGDFVLVLDPNNGKRIMSKSEFYSIWNKDDKGYILVVLPQKIHKLNISYSLPNCLKK
jgi:predicted double-glycine peptidase